ncbi:MAG: DUF4230 domain-containing protein [Prevotella sp.]|jgi:hypothetical protein|nr:DUF4230 domain-containing protein [Prevotella sp.]MBR7048741.1 DUF4230 domain-containing protein [Prevotella sp.]
MIKQFFKLLAQNVKHTLLYIIGLVVIVVTIVWLLVWLNKDNSMEISADRRIDITPAQIVAIQDIGQWEFLAISDEELVDTVSRGFFSDDELMRIYYGTVRLGIDLHQAKPRWIRPQGDSLLVELPPIILLDSNFIDETRTRSFFESGKWSHEAREQLYQKAYDKMLARCMTKENIRIAQENAKVQFTQLLRSMGFEKVVFIPNDSI